MPTAYDLPTTTSYLSPPVPLPIPKPIPSPPTPQTAHAHTPQLTPTSKAEAIARVPGADVLLIGPFRPREQHRAPDPRRPRARRAGRRHRAHPPRRARQREAHRDLLHVWRAGARVC